MGSDLAARSFTTLECPAYAGAAGDRPVDSEPVFRKRSRVPDPGPLAWPGGSTPATGGAGGGEPDGATSDEFDVILARAKQHANLGLPVGRAQRLRFAKRLVYRVSWVFLRHEVAFNQSIIEANQVLAERITRLQVRIEQGLREDLLDFADRGVSQAHAEITDHVTEARNIHADLILEIRTLQAELNTMAKALAPDSLMGRGPAVLEGQRDHTGIDGGPRKSRR
jgi:hypothetical protein